MSRMMLVGLLMLSACSGTPLVGDSKDKAYPMPPANLLTPSRKTEPVPDNASLDEALAVTVRNGGVGRQNAEQLDALIDDLHHLEKAQ